MYFAGGAPPDLLAPLQIGWPCRKSGEEHLAPGPRSPHTCSARWSLITVPIGGCKFGSKSTHRARNRRNVRVLTILDQSAAKRVSGRSSRERNQSPGQRGSPTLER